ncbi:hypothetical protein C7E25_24820, partial [Stenotrophomonas maltophilia]
MLTFASLIGYAVIYTVYLKRATSQNIGHRRLPARCRRCTAVLTFASLIGYAVIYTVYLKRATSQNIGHRRL